MSPSLSLALSAQLAPLLVLSASGAYDPEVETPNLEGESRDCDGANGGVGREGARHLVAYAAKVYIAARNEAQIQEVIDDFRETGGFQTGGSACALVVDFASLRNVKRAADELLGKELRLDILRELDLFAI
ncbi:hypothetical protein FRB90_003480 [Tulasnella sp. 427]|nr:hypothetical protein FRB90_003480 [Tulasnella sp. 427]